MGETESCRLDVLQLFKLQKWFKILKPICLLFPYDRYCIFRRKADQQHTSMFLQTEMIVIRDCCSFGRWNDVPTQVEQFFCKFFVYEMWSSLDVKEADGPHDLRKTHLNSEGNRNRFLPSAGQSKKKATVPFRMYFLTVPVFGIILVFIFGNRWSTVVLESEPTVQRRSLKVLYPIKEITRSISMPQPSLCRR